MENTQSKKIGFGTAPVFFTAISTILGAILFLRFGFAVGTLGFAGVIGIIIIGHIITIPTALAISEIATNQRVEGGGEYFIIWIKYRSYYWYCIIFLAGYKYCFLYYSIY